MTVAAPARTYEWAAFDTHFWKVRPEAAAEEFDRISRRDGVLTPSAIVRDAEPEHSPLHPYFEWDDQRAATEYRHTQARTMIRSLVVVERDPDSATKTVRREYVKVVGAPREEASELVQEAVQPNVYLPITTVMQTPDLRQLYLQRALNDLLRWRRRYEDIQEFAQLFAAIEAYAPA